MKTSGDAPQMKELKTTLLLTIWIHCLVAQAQELPPIQNFSSAAYNSGNQNWGISQSQDKVIYVANNDGLLEFNGARWILHPSPNETIMRSVNVIGNKVYTGCYMEFGYWERTTSGKMVYTSLSSQLGIELIEDEEFWSIIDVDEYVLFQSLNRIYIYNAMNGAVTAIDSEEVIVNMFEINSSIYFQRATSGIYQIENGQDRLLIDDQAITSDEVVNLFAQGNQMLILTRNNGFFSYENGQVKRLMSANKALSGFSIYSAIQLEDQRFALGTISNGLICFDLKQGIIYQIDQQNGLLNNTVLSVFEDTDQNIWLGLDNGISYVNKDSPISFFRDSRGILGSVYASAIHDGYLYLGTNQGLFCKPLNSEQEFEFINETMGQVWCLKVINNELFCGHHKGTYLIQQEEAQQISSVQGTWSIDQLDTSPELLIQGNYDGLYVLEKRGGAWRIRNKVEGFDNSSRYFKVAGNRIFVNHEYKGVFHLAVDEDFNRANLVTLDTLLKGANSSIASYQGKVLYAGREGIYSYDFSEGSFIRDSILSTIYTPEDYVSGRIVLGENDDGFWIFTRDNLILVSSGALADAPKLRSIPLTLNIRNNVIEYENIISIDGLGRYLLGTSGGYITLDSDQLAVSDFSVYIGEIINGTKKDLDFSEGLVDLQKRGAFTSNENNFRIAVHTPAYYAYLQPLYQYQLEGLYEDWSDWSTDAEVFFENLPPGDYSFNVRAKIGEKISQNTASYLFSIAKPWYITHVMLGVYALAFLVLSIFIHNAYRGYYHQQRQVLIDQNEKELALTRLQNEKALIDFKNEQLQLDNKSKSSELAASTMSIAKKNELLTEIKDLLAKVDDQRSIGPVIRLIDRNLDHNQDWELFQEAFNNTDTEFFKDLKAKHHNLSPNDLKMCAYLRLNLSSKEIAQLINISPKSVEVKRYRLRKKLNLHNEENLTEYILSL